MLIRRLKWWFGYLLIRLGWHIYLGEDIHKDYCLGCGIEENGIRYSVDFVAKERGAE